MCVYYLIQKFADSWEVESWVKIACGILGGLLAAPIFYNIALLMTEIVCILFGAVCGAILGRAINEAIAASSDMTIWWGVQI